MAKVTPPDPAHYGMFIGGEWVEAEERLEVHNKYDGSLAGTVACASEAHVERAMTAAREAAAVMAAMPAYRRAAILRAAADGLAGNGEHLARTIAAEAGKPVKYARVEVERAVETFRFAAEEAKRIHGETLPMDAAPAGEGAFGFYLRTPVGVVVAITPFNFPLNLVAHKVAPALAAGNAVVLKPASATPLTAGLLAGVLGDAGLPAGAYNLLFGGGGNLGDRLVTDPSAAKVTFTGSAAVGERILQRAGIKKVTLELGNNAPVIVEADADVERAVGRCVFGSFYNAGQVCISVQRIYVHREVFAGFRDEFVKATEGLVVGDPLDETCDVGPMIDEGEARRLEAWVEEARAGGARIATGGRREGAFYHPTVLTDVRPEMKVSCQEAFGPVVSLVSYGDLDDALAQADDTPYGLQAGIFTRDVAGIFKAVGRLNFGGVMVNEVPAFRVDHMPYGGNRRSGLGREGVRYAVEEMTNLRTVVIKPH